MKTYSHASKDLASSFDQDANTESDKTIRIVVPNHMIPSDVPQDKHPNAAFSNNFIRYKQLQITWSLVDEFYFSSNQAHIQDDQIFDNLKSFFRGYCSIMIQLVLRFVYISGHLVFNICVSSTTKYTLLTFLPKNLFEQFHRFANLYFLFIVLLNWVPSINAFGKEISMLPVIFVLGVTAIKDAFEDRRRYVSDKRVNNSTCRIYNR